MTARRCFTSRCLVSFRPRFSYPIPENPRCKQCPSALDPPGRRPRSRDAQTSRPPGPVTGSLAQPVPKTRLRHTDIPGNPGNRFRPPRASSTAQRRNSDECGAGTLILSRRPTGPTRYVSGETGEPQSHWQDPSHIPTITTPRSDPKRQLSDADSGETSRSSLLATMTGGHLFQIRGVEGVRRDHRSAHRRHRLDGRSS